MLMVMMMALSRWLNERKEKDRGSFEHKGEGRGVEGVRGCVLGGGEGVRGSGGEWRGLGGVEGC